VLILDLNNNKPQIAVLNNIMPINSHLILTENQILKANINENEIGPIMLENTLLPENNYFIVYDSDVGLNGTFILNIEQSIKPDGSSSPLKDLNNFLMANPYNEKEIKNKNTINLINVSPFDFENLDCNSSLGHLTSIGSKTVNFGVG
jgi:hypothetical protein